MAITHQNPIIHIHTQIEIQILTLKIVIKSQEKRTKEEMNNNQKEIPEQLTKWQWEHTYHLFICVAMLCSLPYLSSLTRDWTHALGSESKTTLQLGIPSIMTLNINRLQRLQSNDKVWLNGYKNNTHIDAAHKNLTSDLKVRHADGKWGNGKRISIQMAIKAAVVILKQDKRA